MTRDHENFFARVDEAARYIEDRIGRAPQVTVVLTGGMHGFVDGLEETRTLDYGDIPYFGATRAEGHAGTLSCGRMHGASVAVMEGRFHYYEGHHPLQIIFPYVVLGTLGVHTLITTNAVGGIRADLDAGDIMLVTDHINMMGINPLIGLATQREQNQFTNMIDAYDPRLCELARRAADARGIELKDGVYCAVSGPNYETKAEVRALRTLGADAVGMSTVPEVIAARFLDMKVLSLSCIANAAADRHGGTMSHDEVLASVDAAAPKITGLLSTIVEMMGDT